MLDEGAIDGVSDGRRLASTVGKLWNDADLFNELNFSNCFIFDWN